MRIIAPTLGLLLCTLSACNVLVTGNGVSQTESRSVAAYDALSVSAVFHAVAGVGVQGPLVLSADENILPYIVTEVVDGRLHVRLRDRVSIDLGDGTPIRIQLTAPSLVAAETSGAATLDGNIAPCTGFDAIASGDSEIHLRGLDVDTVGIDASGASVVEFFGRSGSTNIFASGAATVLAHTVDSTDVSVDGSGAAKIDIQASHSLYANLTGASLLRVWGDPPLRLIGTQGAAQFRYQ